MDLKDQDISDNFIENICDNSTFSRLSEINLSGNARITSQSLKYLSDSFCIGGVKDLPQISARDELPSSEIHVYAQGTSINPEVVKIYNSAPQNTDFFIRYLGYFSGKELCRPSRHSLKWVQVVDF